MYEKLSPSNGFCGCEVRTLEEDHMGWMEVIDFNDINIYDDGSIYLDLSTHDTTF